MCKTVESAIDSADFICLLVHIHLNYIWLMYSARRMFSINVFYCPNKLQQNKIKTEKQA